MPWCSWTEANLRVGGGRTHGVELDHDDPCCSPSLVVVFIDSHPPFSNTSASTHALIMGSHPEAVKTEQAASAAPPAGSTSPEKPARKRRLDVNPELILSTEGRSKRRRTPSPGPQTKEDPDPKDPARAKQLGLQLYNKISAMRESE